MIAGWTETEVVGCDSSMIISSLDVSAALSNSNLFGEENSFFYVALLEIMWDQNWRKRDFFSLFRSIYQLLSYYSV